MGLLDQFQQEEADDFAFADFAVGYSSLAANPPSLASSSSTSTASKSSRQSITDSYFPPTPATTTTKTATAPLSPRKDAASPSPTRPRPRRRKLTRGNSFFDVFGEDEELQQAEPRIGFCELCLKDCDVHEHAAPPRPQT